MLHFTYRIVNLINGRFYIGKHSTSNIEDGYLGSGYALKYDIKKYGRENFIMCNLEFFNTEDEAYIHEGKLIDDIWSDVLLHDRTIFYNITGGGKGAGSGEKNPNYGKPLSEEYRRKISEAKKGKKRPPQTAEHQRKLSESLKEYYRLHPMVKKPKQLEIKFKKPKTNSKPIYQYSLNGDYIASYKSITEASKAIVGKRTGIYYCCKGSVLSSGGYQWNFKKFNRMPPYKTNEVASKAVFQFNIETGKLIYEFPSIGSAKRAVNGNHIHILKCCTGIRKSAYGYRWSFIK